MPHVDYARWDEYISQGRSGVDRPVANNTRVHRRSYGDPAIAIRLHNTDVVTIYEDGSRALSTGGWRTATTKARIREYGSTYVSGSIETQRSSAGRWFVACEHDPRDPHPNGGRRASRSIPKPFYAADPGPEPVKATDGCIAGEREPYSYAYEETIYEWSRTGVRPSDVIVRIDSYGTTVRRWANGIIEHTAERYRWHRPEAGVEYRQCPHCAAFERAHGQWSVRANGERWGRNRGQGYRQMCEMLDRFGSRDAWQDAYLTELREVREMSREIKAWNERNYVPFFDGIIVQANGLVSLAEKRAHCKRLERAAIEARKLERKRKQVQRQQARELAKIERRRSHKREVMADVAKALADAAFAETEIKRQESFVH